MYDTLPMALSEIVNRLAFTIENTRADKLGAVVGRTTGGSIQPDKMESPFSGRAIADIEDTLVGIETLYFGDEADGVVGLNGYLGSRGYHYDDEVHAEMAKSRAALDEIGDLRRAIEDRPQDVDAAIDALEALQRLIQVDLINALALSVRFNDNDGD
jgi:predicted lipoprotein